MRRQSDTESQEREGGAEDERREGRGEESGGKRIAIIVNTGVGL
jgi:hypothetical protein